MSHYGTGLFNDVFEFDPCSPPVEFVPDVDGGCDGDCGPGGSPCDGDCAG